jgi:lipoprotein-anchoring transpeptidase ErfK/SrfK
METPASQPRLPEKLKHTIRRTGTGRARFVFTVSVAAQRMLLFEKARTVSNGARFPEYVFRRRFVVSTSRYGIGQVLHSHQTPLGLHRIARKVGGGQPIGTVFRNRRPVGFTWQGRANGGIVHRIFWLEGLEPGLNRGGQVDTFQRYIYIHGFGDETTIGRPQSSGCIHLRASDLIPLYERIPEGSLVWIAER